MEHPTLNGTSKALGEKETPGERRLQHAEFANERYAPGQSLVVSRTTKRP
mgnify:CR=1 FL=1